MNQANNTAKQPAKTSGNFKKPNGSPVGNAIWKAVTASKALDAAMESANFSLVARRIGELQIALEELKLAYLEMLQRLGREVSE